MSVQKDNLVPSWAQLTSHHTAVRDPQFPYAQGTEVSVEIL